MKNFKPDPKFQQNGNPSIYGDHFYSEDLVNADADMMEKLSAVRTLLERRSLIQDHEMHEWKLAVEKARFEYNSAITFLRRVAKNEGNPKFLQIDFMHSLSHKLTNYIFAEEYALASRLAFTISELHYFVLLDDESWNVSPSA